MSRPIRHRDKQTLLGFYTTMLRIRLCEEGFVAPIAAGEIRCPVHLCSGQEAVATGVCANLSPRDYVFGTHRSHGHYIAKGGDLRRLVAEIYCRETGCARGRGGSMHVIAPEAGMLGAAPIVAGTIALAVGAAYASWVRSEERIAVAFFGDGAAGEGVLYESMNIAALRRLPVLFVCENNLYSTHLPIRECRVSEEIYKSAEPLGVRASRVDGNDVLAVHEAAREAVSRCRSGAGPSFLECLTYRLRGHVGPDDNVQGNRTDIRPASELAAWKERDPILRLERVLLSQGLVDNGDLERVRGLVQEEIEEAVAFARESCFPAPGCLHANLTHEP
ncbi:MAG: thiamine pyrophosphate-dependent dehydrogenase E1 component subunit alpha [Acidobacteriota bacterium]